MVGTYNYPDEVPDDVYKRHRHCRCIVEYFPGDGKKQDVWSKEWEDVDKEDKIQERFEYSETDTGNKKFPKEIAGAKRGEQMSFEEADGSKPNPKYSEDEIYKINRQTCVVAYEARRRGYDVEAKGNFKGSVSEMLSRATNKARIDPKTGKHPEYIRPGYASNITTPTRYMKYLNDIMKSNTRYTIEFEWKGKGNGGHIVHIFKDDDGIKTYDPQVGETYSDVKGYLKDVRFTRSIGGNKFSVAPELLEVENCEFDMEIVN